MRIALVCREVEPFVGGGLAAYVAASARLLARVAEVTVLTSSHWRSAQAGDAGDGVRLEFVDEPTEEEAGAYYDFVHCYSGRVLERLRELYADRPPDLIEFADYQGEAFVTVQAARTLDRFLEGTTVCVRLHTTKELVDVLNGRYDGDRRMRARYELERYSLACADRLLWAGGDVHGTYRRYYGKRGLAPALRVRHPLPAPAAHLGEDAGYRCAGALRILYAGRLERRKGVLELLSAIRGCSRDDLHLTLVGADTPTGPMGVSIRAMLELEIAEDPRIELRGALSREAVGELIGAHDLVVLPSLWECWPYAALEALALNRPLLATPTGGLIELAEPGRGGWLTAGTGSGALAAALEQMPGRTEEIEELIAMRRPASLARSLSDPQAILDAYQALARLRPRVRRRVRASAPPPLVSAIIPYHRAARFVRATIDSLLAQTHPRLEIVLVNDGSFEEEDWLLGDLAARLPLLLVSQGNRGLGAARNFGIAQSRGRYVFPLDADNVAHPEFIARCVAALEHRPQLAYVTAWSRYIDERGEPLAGPGLGYQPLGNRSPLVAVENVAGDAAAVIPRRIFDLGFRYSEELASYEDWHLYRELHRAGRHGAVIPQRLLGYRVRADQMQAQVAQPHRARLEGEIRALLRENEVQWTSSSA